MSSIPLFLSILREANLLAFCLGFLVNVYFVHLFHPMLSMA